MPYSIIIVQPWDYTDRALMGLSRATSARTPEGHVDGNSSLGNISTNSRQGNFSLLMKFLSKQALDERKARCFRAR